jgi:hypothetical protein
MMIADTRTRSGLAERISKKRRQGAKLFFVYTAEITTAGILVCAPIVHMKNTPCRNTVVDETERLIWTSTTRSWENIAVSILVWHVGGPGSYHGSTPPILTDKSRLSLSSSHTPDKCRNLTVSFRLLSNYSFPPYIPNYINYEVDQRHKTNKESINRWR